jgi:hypothetical protein
MELKFVTTNEELLDKTIDAHRTVVQLLSCYRGPGAPDEFFRYIMTACVSIERAQELLEAEKEAAISV